MTPFEVRLRALDWLIIAVYVASTMVLGFWIARRATRNTRSYFLGGNQIPWYMLGLSNASGMFDISGTMWLVYLLFVYGLKSIWIPWLWPVFNQVFLMVFLSVWLRRSGAMTGAQWIAFRFGTGRGAQMAHLVVVLFALVNVIGFLAYGFVGIGKFAATFLPWQLAANPETNAHLWGLVVTALTTVYVVKGGMISVVATEVLQFGYMTLACIGVAAVAMYSVSPALLTHSVPAGWASPWFGATTGLDWMRLMPAAQQRIATDGFAMFGAFFMMMTCKGILLSTAGPAPNYDMQRVLSARTPREAAKMSAIVTVVLMVPRYLLVAGLTVLALTVFGQPLRTMGDRVDFELILPLVLRHAIPTGLLGLLIAALLAAFMGTYAATVNAAPAYIVNDIYRRFIRPAATEKTLVRMSWATSLAVVVVGTAIGFWVSSLNDIILWLVSALYGGYTASNVLKWYWWRFNSHGYFWGMAGGILASMLVPVAFPGLDPFRAFPAILALSLACCIVATLLTPPDDEAVLKNFYLKVRPWGFWGPIHEKLARERPGIVRNTAFRRDMMNVVVGTVWQTAQVALGIYIVLRDWTACAICVALIAVTSVVLKKSWYDRLEDHPADRHVERDAPPHAAVAVLPRADDRVPAGV